MLDSEEVSSGLLIAIWCILYTQHSTIVRNVECLTSRFKHQVKCIDWPEDPRHTQLTVTMFQGQNSRPLGPSNFKGQNALGSISLCCCSNTEMGPPSKLMGSKCFQPRLGVRAASVSLLFEILLSCCLVKSIIFRERESKRSGIVVLLGLRFSSF
jgi:hypothetical protein